MRERILVYLVKGFAPWYPAKKQREMRSQKSGARSQNDKLTTMS
jgi:hypothetical protein